MMYVMCHLPLRWPDCHVQHIQSAGLGCLWDDIFVGPVLAINLVSYTVIQASD